MWRSLDLDDHPFTVQEWDEPCAICGSKHSYLDEVVLDDTGKRCLSTPTLDYAANRSERANSQETAAFGYIIDSRFMPGQRL